MVGQDANVQVTETTKPTILGQAMVGDAASGSSSEKPLRLMPLVTSHPDPELQEIAALANALKEEELRKVKEQEENDRALAEAAQKAMIEDEKLEKAVVNKRKRPSKAARTKHGRGIATS
ncbi:hypothetical protein SESBI_34406 [Sesbania bispinosa]|nr:hypothetical protein SESBI_34406 [Sesbania bispinosa]